MTTQCLCTLASARSQCVRVPLTILQPLAGARLSSHLFGVHTCAELLFGGNAFGPTPSGMCWRRLHLHQTLCCAFTVRGGARQQTEVLEKEKNSGSSTLTNSTCHTRTQAGLSQDDSFEAGHNNASVPADAAMSDATAAVRRLQRWRSAANKARAAVRLRVGGGLRAPAPDAAAPAAPANTEQKPCSKYCHTIPEQPSSEDVGGWRRAAGSHEGRMGCGDRWRCPLSCRPEELPEGAELHGCLLNIGEAPDMKSCKSTWTTGGAYSSPAAASSEDGGPGVPEALPRAPLAPTEDTVRVPLGFVAGMDAVSGDAHARQQRDAPRSSHGGEGLQRDELAEAARNAEVPDAAPDRMPWCTSGGRISIVECREEGSTEGRGASTSPEDVCVAAVASKSEE